MTASLKWRPCSRAISCTMSTIQASPASEPDVPDEPMINGIPALTARIIMISVSRFTAAAENMQMPVASGPGPGSVLPASQPIIRAPSEIALSSDSARNPEPSMPVAETSGNDAMAKLLDAIAGEDIVCRTVRKPMDARWYLKLVIDARWAAHPLDPAPPTTAFGALPVLAGAHYQLRRYQQAVEAGRRSWSLNRNWPIGLRYVVAGLAQLGRIEEAH